MKNQTHKMLNKLLLPDRRTYIHTYTGAHTHTGENKMEKVFMCVCVQK